MYNSPCSCPSCSAWSAATARAEEGVLVRRARHAYLGSMNETPEIALTASAAARVAAIAKRQGKPPILRLAVDGGGCAGFQYRFGLADAVEAGDTTALQDRKSTRLNSSH